MGRPLKPTALKVLNGSAAHHPERRNDLEPMIDPLAEVPSPPFKLRTKAAKTAWERDCRSAIALGTLDQSNLVTMALASDAFGEWQSAIREQRRGDAFKQREAYFAFLATFGLNAVAKAKVHAAPKTQQSKMAGLLAKRAVAG